MDLPWLGTDDPLLVVEGQVIPSFVYQFSIMETEVHRRTGNSADPFVTVIMPIRNEAGYICQSLGSVLSQEYPPERMEVLVVDGMSSDETREIVAGIAAGDPRVLLLDNPRHIMPTGVNIGLRAARGDVIMLVSGHCKIPTNYVRLCVECLGRTGADNVGGMQYPVGETYVAQAIAATTSSPFGIGNARFRYSEKPGYVDTVYLGAYRRDVFKRIGLFDEELVRHQDYEFNCRLRRAGGKVFYNPAIQARYFSRSTLGKLARQYFEYAYWKVRVMQKNPQAFTLRHLVPASFSLAVLTGAVLSIFLSWARLPYLGLWVLYLVTSLGASTYISARRGWRYLRILPLAFAAIHLGWGLGFWWGLIRWNLLPAPPLAKPPSL